MANGKELAAANLRKFESWVVEREAALDWADYIHQRKLNRTEIAAECGFAKSVLQQNPRVKAALEALEGSLRTKGILPQAKTKKPSQCPSEVAMEAVEQRVIENNRQADKHIKALQERNAALLAQVRELEEQLRQYQHLDEHLGLTGRMLPQ